jgi:hypothetical protein
MLPSTHTLYLCVLHGSQNKQRIFLYTALTGRFYNRDGTCLLRGMTWTARMYQSWVQDPSLQTSLSDIRDRCEIKDCQQNTHKSILLLNNTIIEHTKTNTLKTLIFHIFQIQFFLLSLYLSVRPSLPPPSLSLSLSGMPFKFTFLFWATSAVSLFFFQIIS